MAINTRAAIDTFEDVSAKLADLEQEQIEERKNLIVQMIKDVEALLHKNELTYNEFGVVVQYFVDLANRVHANMTIKDIQSYEQFATTGTGETADEQGEGSVSEGQPTDDSASAGASSGTA